VTGLIAFGLALFGALALALYGLRYRNKPFDLRTMPVFQSLTDEVGRVAEEGATIHIALGKGGLLSEDALTSIATLQGLRALIDLAAAYDTPPLITTGEPTLYLMTRDWMRRAYVRIGNAAQFRPVFVQYTAASPAVYAAMAATYMFDGTIGSNVMIGTFDEEVSLLADAAHRRGIESMGGSVSPQGLGALYPALDKEQLVMGEDLFAGSAVASTHSTYQTSLRVQETLRWLVIVSIIIISVMSILNVGGL